MIYCPGCNKMLVSYLWQNPDLSPDENPIGPGWSRPTVEDHPLMCLCSEYPFNLLIKLRTGKCRRRLDRMKVP